MNKMFGFFRFALLTLTLLVSGLVSKANHLVGMDLKYQHISGNTYKIILIAYANCGSAGSSSAYGLLPTNTPAIYIYNGASYITTINLTIEAPSAGVEITPVCPADSLQTQCTNVAFTTPGIKKFTYSGTYTVSGPSTAWRFLFTGDLGGSSAGRALAITNISSTPVTFIQLVDTLNNSTSFNNSPNLSVVPTPFFCENNTDNYNPGALDADGDSLTFFLVNGINGTTTTTSGGSVTYLGAFTGANPLAVTTMTFVPSTGQITFFPNALQRSLVVYNIEEHRAGVLVGTSQREMTFLVLTCTNTPASGGIVGATNGIIDDSVHFHICQNTGAFSFNVNPTEPDVTNNITVTWAGLPTGSTFTVTGNNTPTPHGTFAWTSTGVAPGTYTFFLTFTDNNCPLAGVQTLAYNVTIDPQPTVTDSLSITQCDGKAQVTVIPGGTSPWVIKISGGVGDTVYSNTSATGTITDSLGAGTYTITVVSTAGCSAFTTFNIPPVVQPTISYTLLWPVSCVSKGAIQITPGGAAPWVVKVSNSAGDTITAFTGVTGPFIDSVTPGTYTFTIFNNIGCSAFVTVTVADPPNMTPTATFTNPSYCGADDGTITIHSLWPGTIDTIKFSYNGVAQPPLVFTVAVDSTVTLIGLPAGAYTGMTATYGNCISTAVSATLVNPPFTMRAITSTNPSWCGICDGTITLYGLHPGQTDTITYTLGGVAQPPVVATIPTDSMVVITGLCQGVYANFVAKTAGLCVSNTLGPVTLTPPPFLIRAISQVNPVYCGICNGTITLYGLHPGDIDTIHYTYNGVPAAPIVLAIPADSQVVITNLCAGSYTNITASKVGGCISNAETATLTVPPFTMRAITSVNPSYCGICDGSITLYGLYPGQLDTINYTYNGVAQPRVVVLVPLDSQVVLTGLCEGTYAGFVASTAGICVSNTLGPVTLAVPPFTINRLTFTNPTKCGFCDGIITIHGAHPGQMDTINYKYNGVWQTSFSATVAPDSTLQIPGLCEGTYDSVFVNTGGLCKSNVLGPVTLVAPPIIAAFIDDVHLGCKGDTVYFTNQSTPASDLTYRWFFGDGTTDISTSPVHIYTASGTFNVRLIITNTKCFDSVNHNVILNNIITAGFHTIPASEVCQGSPVDFINTSSGTLLTYKWFFGDGSTSTVDSPTHSFTNSGNYTVMLAVANFEPCYDTVYGNLTVDTLSAISLTATDSAICRQGSITFTGNYSTMANTGEIWTVSNGLTAANQNPAQFSFTQAGTYTVSLQVMYRVCPTVSASTSVRVYNNPQVNLGPDTTICAGSNGIELVDLINTGNAAASWLWSTGQKTPRITVGMPGVYSLNVTIDGCTSTDSVNVSNDCYMDIPNAFTPNGDGVNDYFFPRQMLTKGLTSFAMNIYNRWGQEIFTTTTTDGRGWDGMFNNVPQPEGVYIYIIDAVFKDGQHEHHQGNITLMR